MTASDGKEGGTGGVDAGRRRGVSVLDTHRFLPAVTVLLAILTFPFPCI